MAILPIHATPWTEQIGRMIFLFKYQQNSQIMDKNNCNCSVTECSNMRCVLMESNCCVHLLTNKTHPISSLINKPCLILIQEVTGNGKSSEGWKQWTTYVHSMLFSPAVQDQLLSFTCFRATEILDLAEQQMDSPTPTLFSLALTYSTTFSYYPPVVPEITRHLFFKLQI